MAAVITNVKLTPQVVDAGKNFVIQVAVDFPGLIFAEMENMTWDHVDTHTWDELSPPNYFNPALVNGDVEVLEGEIYKLDASQNTSFEDFQTSIKYDVEPGNKYAVTFYADWTARLVFEPRCYDAGGVALTNATVTYVINPEPIVGAYQLYKLIFTVPANAVSCEFFRWWYGPSSDDIAYLKDVRLELKNSG